MSYLPIAEHGVIGDLRSAALVGTDGTVDWFCAPRFDSPSIFASILDDEVGGCWRLEPTCEVTNQQQFYIPDTNVLVTRFLTADGIVEVQDLMPLLRPHDPDHRQLLVRQVVCVRGKVSMSTRVQPRPDYGRQVPTATAVTGGVRFAADALTLELGSDVTLHLEDGVASAEFDVQEGQTFSFVLEPCETDAGDLTPQGCDDLYVRTVRYWQDWISHSTYRGRWRETVHRSALTLKLMTHEPTGAVIAAPTTSLPEHIGGERNWDYRYVWPRDAAFSLYALLKLGFTEEASAFIEWLSHRFEDPRDGRQGPLRVLYTIDGDCDPPETVLDHLEGYKGSSPVHAGNGAADQLQLDIYGELIDSIYLYDKYADGISHAAWENLCGVVEWLKTHWDQPDEGIWETRAGRADHTYSRLMCWVALERMIRMARRRGLPGDISEWSRVRDEIYHQIMDRGWDDEQGAFVQRYDSHVLDASILLMPMVKFLVPSDPRFLSTLKRIEEQLRVDALVYRYDVAEAPDGLDGEEGTFSICSFWYVEALTRSGQLDEARLELEKMFTYGNHLGLYAEQVGLTGEHLGNFPQAFTHLALISSAINLDRALG
jgi:GH15 family glucan-1,4-alpha-glucosidase